ncbi:MAG: sigma-E processing peptidase SpoIIGA [Clostridia bacterium]|nr:sigma-E processing peptidase SpoIIGA [Clostridia bacterium]MBQ1554985.1 sigma-E processing peptidase SpoIIGA [Clostridia bacterium]
MTGLKQTVYVDVLLAINFFVNYFLLLSSGRILRIRISRTRLCLAAVLGAVSSLTLFLPRMDAVKGTLFKLAVSAVMVLAAFGWGGGRRFARQMLVVCAVTLGFGGTMLALWLTLSPGGMVYRNGVIYFPLSPLFVMGATAGCYAVITVAGKIASRMELRGRICEAAMTYGSRTVSLRLLCDTGNGLSEPFSGAPVIVVRQSAVAGLLPEGFTRLSSRLPDGGEALPRHVRLIPYATVGGGGLLAAFRPDRLVIYDGKREITPEGCYIAVSEQMEDGAYDGIVHPGLFMK